LHFKFDEKAYKAYHKILLPSLWLWALIIFIIHKEFGLNTVFVIIFAVPAFAYSASHLKFWNKTLKEKNQDKIVVSKGYFKFENKITGYKIAKPLGDIVSVKTSNFLFIPRVSINFKNNEVLSLSWVQNRDGLVNKLQS
jgi:hypothetical protein